MGFISRWASPAPHPTAPHDLPGYNVVTHDLSLPNGGLASAVRFTKPPDYAATTGSLYSNKTLLHFPTICHYSQIFFLLPTHTQSIYIFLISPLLWLFKWNLASSKLVCSCTYTFIYIYIGIQMFEIYFCCMTSREIFFLSKTTWQDHRPTS